MVSYVKQNRYLGSRSIERYCRVDVFIFLEREHGYDGAKHFAIDDEATLERLGAVWNIRRKIEGRGRFSETFWIQRANQ